MCKTGILGIILILTFHFQAFGKTPVSLPEEAGYVATILDITNIVSTGEGDYVSAILVLSEPFPNSHALMAVRFDPPAGEEKTQLLPVRPLLDKEHPSGGPTKELKFTWSASYYGSGPDVLKGKALSIYSMKYDRTIVAVEKNRFVILDRPIPNGTIGFQPSLIVQMDVETVRLDLQSDLTISGGQPSLRHMIDWERQYLEKLPGKKVRIYVPGLPEVDPKYWSR